jgi:hypothetical protein
MLEQNGPGCAGGATEAGIGIAERRSVPRSTFAGPAPIAPGASTHARMRLRVWRPMRRNTLRGFASVTLPTGLDIDDVAVHVSGSRSWASMPARPMLDAGGRALRDDSGKIRYAQPVRWSTHGLASTFGQKVVALVRAAHPDALGEAER